MNFEFSKHGWNDFEYWILNDIDVTIKINNILKSIRSSPFKGLGKPEPLKHVMKGYWSRRISREHRLIYKITGVRGIDQKCYIIQCRYHYDD